MRACPGPVWIDTVRKLLVEFVALLQQTAMITLCKLTFVSLGCIHLPLLPDGNTSGTSGGCAATDPSIDTVWAIRIHECGECFGRLHLTFCFFFLFITVPFLFVALRCSVVLGKTSSLDMVPPGSNVIKHHFLGSWRYLGVVSAGPFTRHAPTAWKYNMTTQCAKVLIVLLTSIGGRWGGAGQITLMLLTLLWAAGLLAGSIFFRPFAGVPLCRIMVVARAVVAWTVVYLAVQVRQGCENRTVSMNGCSP